MATNQRPHAKTRLFSTRLLCFLSPCAHHIMSIFFELLPADLQLDILCAWLNKEDCGLSLLRVLSALDVACSQSDQPASAS